MNKRRVLATAGIILFAIIILIAASICYKNSKWQDSTLENAEYEGVYCAMDSIPFFSEEDFLMYRGLKVIVSHKQMESFRHIEDMLEIVFTSNPNVNTVYMEINPVLLWKDASSKEVKWSEYMEKYLLEKVRQQSGTTFEFLLASPQISYWMNTNEKKLDEYLQAYKAFADALENVQNVVIFYTGAEQWLTHNKDNYTSDFQMNAPIEKTIFLSAFCDRKYLVNPEVMTLQLAELKQQIEIGKNYSIEYPDYSEWNLVFFGDSIIGKEKDTSSIPGVVEALTEATTYNCGKSGAAATSDQNAELSFLDQVAAVLEGDTEKITEEELLKNIERFRQSEKDGKKLCFFINYGLNDYFIGYPVDNPENAYDAESYAGALRVGIRQLKEAYPECEIVIMVPTYTGFYNEGADIMSEKGGVLEEYRQAAKAVAQQMQVYCKDNYLDMEINSSNQENYLLDGCHLNGWGRFYLAEQTVWFLKENVIP